MSTYMRRALELARLGRTSPNPQVGCVIVKNGRIVAEGYHTKAGKPHAEIEALSKIGFDARGCVMYVTLEPCCHWGRTGPCTEALIKSGIKRVVVGMRDPNPRVSGRGIRALRKADIRVDVGVMAGESAKMNEFYVKYITTGMPFVILKAAMSLDGMIATKNGDSKWISCGESRGLVHELRDRVDAVLVGVGTVLSDDPELTCRIKGGRNPLRVIVDSKLRIPLDAKVLRDKNVLIATTKGCSGRKRRLLEGRGFEVAVVGGGGGVGLRKLMKVLGGRGVTSVLIEGGSRINASALREGVVDRLVLFIAPFFVGGDGVPVFSSLGVDCVGDVLRMKRVLVGSVGCDLLVESDIHTLF